MKTIDELWKKLKDVELIQVRPSEMEVLYKHCFEFRQPFIVEVGSAHGASSIILAEAAQELKGKLICIDPYPENYYDQEKFGDYARQAFKKNVLKKYKGVVHLDEDSSKATELFAINRSIIDILFIDGDHSYEAVKRDCENLLPLLGDGAYVGFHDYNNPEFSGVKQAADEFCNGWPKQSEWDLVVFKKLWNY